MCGRYPSPSDAARLLKQFEVRSIPDYRPQPNIAPTDLAPVVVKLDGARKLRYMRWGLLPHWAKDTKAAARMINARIETVFEKPAYAKYIRRNRCIIPALGFFEWNEAKDPFLIRLKSGGLMGFAGIWSRWHDPVEPKRVLETYSILTTDANSLVAAVHDRMPALVDPNQYGDWLNREIQDIEKIARMVYFVRKDEVELLQQDRTLNNSRCKTVELRI